MTDESQIKKPDIVEMAKKKRHIKIIQKIKDPNDVPSRSEVEELKRLERGPGQEGIVDTHEYVARAFGVSVRTVRNWAADGMPVMRDGRYSIAEIQAWRFKKQLKNQPDPQAQNWEEEYRKYKALQEQINYRVKRGEVFSRAEIERGLIEIFTAIKTLLLSIPKTVSPQLQGLDARQIESVLNIRVKEIITMISTEKIFLRQKTKDEQTLGKRKKT